MKYTDTSHRQLKKFDNSITQLLMDDLDKRIVVLQEPQCQAKNVVAPKLGTYWRYHVGGVRVLAVNHKPGWGW